MCTTTLQPAVNEPVGTGRVYRPHVDILAREDELLVRADMPGTQADAIDIRYEDGILTIHGKVAPRGEAARRTLLHEYGVGDFHHTFRLGESIDAASIRAEYERGVLSIRLPRSAASKPRRIEVRPGH